MTWPICYFLDILWFAILYGDDTYTDSVFSNHDMYPDCCTAIYCNALCITAPLHLILHNQHHGCWWPGDTKSQGISSHSTDHQYSCFSTKGLTMVHHVNSSCWIFLNFLPHGKLRVWSSSYIIHPVVADGSLHHQGISSHGIDPLFL